MCISWTVCCGGARVHTRLSVVLCLDAGRWTLDAGRGRCFAMIALRAVIGFLVVIGHKDVFSFVPVGVLNVAGGSTRMKHVSRAARCSYIRPLTASRPDDVGEPSRVGFVTSVDREDEDAEEAVGEEERATLQTVNQRLLAEIEEQGKGITIPTEESKKILRREEDLNGVNPFFAILGAAGAAAMSFGSWKATLWFAQAYYSKPAEESDILAVARLTSFVKQAVVGLFALGAGIFGVTALGMAVMAGIVAVGVAKGELDPSPQASASKGAPTGASAAEVDSLMVEQAEASLRKAQADIERDIGGRM